MKVAVGSLPVDDLPVLAEKSKTPETYRQHSSKNIFCARESETILAHPDREADLVNRCFQNCGCKLFWRSFWCILAGPAGVSQPGSGDILSRKDR